MKIRKKIRSIAVILFTVILALNSVSAEASGLKLFNGKSLIDVDEAEKEKGVEFDGAIGTHEYVPVDPGLDSHTFRSGGRVETTAGTCVTQGTKKVYCGYPRVQSS